MEAEDEAEEARVGGRTKGEERADVVELQHQQRHAVHAVALHPRGRHRKADHLHEEAHVAGRPAGHVVGQVVEGATALLPEVQLQLAIDPAEEVVLDGHRRPARVHVREGDALGGTGRAAAAQCRRRRLQA